IWSLFLLAPVIFLQLRATPPPEKEQHRLYVAVPGIRNDLEYGGVGILVYDIDVGYKFIKRIPTWDVPPGEAAENVKGTAVIAKIKLDSGAHNTIYGPDGSRVYLAGLRSPILSVADTKTHTVVNQIGPFSNSIRPFTINGSQTLCFVNVNELLGFEVGDCKTGRMLYRVEVT